MIVTEQIAIRGRQFTRTTSDADLMIRKVGTNEVYASAVDVLDYEYEETDMPIERKSENDLESRLRAVEQSTENLQTAVTELAGMLIDPGTLDEGGALKMVVKESTTI